ncbi:MAG: T9SS type A sorting domain-containing protein [Prevotellaceae bacterium]|nr:T9SS type A sorting domain-containing protein [Prevotellaceae bacterium]
MQGVLLERTFGSRLDLSGYPSGVYVLRAGSKAARIVKQ